MKLQDSLTPEDIRTTYADIFATLDKKHDLEKQLREVERNLEDEKSKVVTAPGFVAAKNMALEEQNFRGMWPGVYKKIDTLKEAIKLEEADMEVSKQEVAKYRLIVDYFEAFKTIE